MANDDGQQENFGCEHCWPSTAEAAWDARATLTHTAELIDESHFHVMILACPQCTQRFVSVFTEMIDWVDGEDPQEWALLPLTAAEADDLVQQGDSLTEPTLMAMGSGRRCLQRVNPKAGAQQIFWGTGMYFGPHD